MVEGEARELGRPWREDKGMALPFAADLDVLNHFSGTKALLYPSFSLFLTEQNCMCI